MNNLGMGGHGQSASADHGAPTVFDSVLGHTKAVPASQVSGGIQLDSHEDSAPGFAGTLTRDALRAAASFAALGVDTLGTAPATHAQPAQPAAQAAKPAPVKPAPAPAKPKPAHAAPAKPAPAKPKPAPHVVPKPFLVYDSVTPTSIPSNHQVATYANGSYAASASAVAGRGHVLWIDTNGSDPHADVLDVEPGDATPAGAAAWVQDKLSHDSSHVAIVYTMISDWQAVRDNVAGLPHWMQDKVRYWIADPTGVPHVLPGSNATQWYWGNSYDITTANPGFES
jgi:hypothetical protein